MGSKMLTEIFIDDGDKRDFFFISVPINNRECISFDWTHKGQRIILQHLKKKDELMLEESSSGEWNTIVICNGKYLRTERIIWHDMGKEDWINNELWETIKERQLDAKAAEKLLKYSLIVRDHYKELEKYAEDMKNFVDLLEKLIQSGKKMF